MNKRSRIEGVLYGKFNPITISVGSDEHLGRKLHVKDRNPAAKARAYTAGKARNVINGLRQLMKNAS